MNPAFAPTEAPQKREPGAIAMELVQARVQQRLFGGAMREVSIGRFTVVATAGAGGLGVVYEAFDPELDRRVAIKLVSPSPLGGTVQSQARLLTEAQTMARLSHPNIVTVHEVGEWDGRVFIAMEHVDGQTLERWVYGSPAPSRPQILRAYVQAGRGLAAAHRAGVVHRDFKPTNAMIDRTERVRVLDFGLAIADDGDDDGDSHSSSSSEGHTAATHGGTPLYMSPEQHERQPATARSDQYSFCVSLWSALYGLHPFARDDMSAMLDAMARGAVRPPPRRSVPAWLRRILLRGLSFASDDRWPSMDALVDALERGQARARRNIMLAALGSVAVVAATLAGLRELDERRQQAACERAGLELAAPWNDDARVAVSDAILATGLGYAATTVDKLLPHLDAYAEALVATGTEACLAGELTHRLPPELYARSKSCLADRQDALAVLLEELSHADAELVRIAVTAALALPEVQTCSDEARLALLPEPPAEQSDELRALRAKLVRVRVLRGADHIEPALAVLDGAASAVQALDWTPLSAELEVERAGLLGRQGSFAAAELAGHQAYIDAARVGAWDVAARAAARQLETVGTGLGRHDEALLWNQLAELAELHAGEQDGMLASARLTALAGLHYDRSDLLASKAAAEAAVAIDERVLGPDNPRIMRSLTVLADAHLELADYPAARVVCERVIDIGERALGEDHPATGSALGTLARVEQYAGNLEQARALLLRALGSFERALGPTHLTVARTLMHLGVIEVQLGEPAMGRARLERALTLLEATYGPHHPIVGEALSNLANTYYLEGDLDAALPLFERALVIDEKTLGPEHPNLARSLGSIALVYIRGGRLLEAQPLLERAVAIGEASLGREHPDVALMLYTLADVHRRRGELARALELIERALVAFDAHEGVQQAEPGSQFMLATLLVDSGGDRARALASAHTALAGFRELERRKLYVRGELEQVQAWLAEHEAEQREPVGRASPQ